MKLDLHKTQAGNLLMVPSGRRPIQKAIEDISQMKTLMRKGCNNLQYNAATRRFAKLVHQKQTQDQNQDRLVLSGSYCNMEL